jgi:hypothetical protein
MAVDVITSQLLDLSNDPMTAEVPIDDGGYIKISRASTGGNSVTPVSAFNSSI